MYFLAKRIFDIIFSCAVLMLMLPLFVLISLAIVVNSGCPVFYLQDRIGKDWHSFKIIKFRTMVKDAEKIGPGISLANDARITFVGGILRKFKLDELPQFINVLTGRMSIIGPRPELKKFASCYPDEYSEILKIKPGITDFASIKFRNESKLLKDNNESELFYTKEILPVKISLCQKYISEMNFITDLKIIFKTAAGILLCK